MIKYLLILILFIGCSPRSEILPVERPKVERQYIVCPICGNSAKIYHLEVCDQYMYRDYNCGVHQTRARQLKSQYEMYPVWSGVK